MLGTIVIVVDIFEVEWTLRILNKQNGGKMASSLDRFLNEVFSSLYVKRPRSKSSDIEKSAWQTEHCRPSDYRTRTVFEPRLHRGSDYQTVSAFKW